VALLNLNLTTITIALVALPLAWIEMVIAALIALWCLAPSRSSA
jgi:phage shock protein PspC (stress-responsive transcriptional regulator)